MRFQLMTLWVMGFPGESRILLSFDGKRVSASRGDTVASALMKSGFYTFSRSLKYHRRRGYKCGRGYCRACLVEVNGIPNVPACITRVEEGMRVRSQNALPSAEFDLLSVLDKFPGLVSYKGLYEGLPGKWFVWPLSWRLIERLVGLGRFPQEHGDYGKGEQVEAEVLVVGGGLSGLAAASLLAEEGLNVTLVDSMETLGGYARLDPLEDAGLHERHEYESPQEAARELSRRARSAGVKILTSTDAYGLYPSKNLVGAYVRESYRSGRHLAVKFKYLILATGAYEEPGLFENNDLPGIMYDYGFRRLIVDHDFKISGRVAVVGRGWRASRLAAFLEAAGVEIVGPYGDLSSKDSERIIAAYGRKKVSGVIVDAGNRRRIGVEYIAVAKGFYPALELAAQAGVRLRFDARIGAHVPEHDGKLRVLNNVWVAGSLAGYLSYADRLASGLLAAYYVLVAEGRREYAEKAAALASSLRAGVLMSG